MRTFAGLCLMVVLMALELEISGKSVLLMQAHARWKPVYSTSPYKAWFERQRNKEGWNCCDRGDAHPVYDAYIKQGKWHVLVDGIHREIEPFQVLDGPNPTGHGIVWYSGKGKGLIIFCFSPGPLY